MENFQHSLDKTAGFSLWNCGDRNALRVWQGIPSAMWTAQLARQTSVKMHLGTWRQLGFKAVCLPELHRETCNPSSMHESLLDVNIIGYEWIR